MRQLGARLPEVPPVKTDVETPSAIQPHERHTLEALEPFPVEVHRIERSPIEAVPETPPPTPEPMTNRVSPEPIVQQIAAPPTPLESAPEPAAETQLPPEASPEPIVATSGSEAETQAGEPSAAVVELTPEPVTPPAAPLSTAPESPEPIAEMAAVTQMPPKFAAEWSTATEAAPEPMAEPVEPPTQVPPQPFVAAAAMQTPAEPASAQIRITEAPRNTAEPPLRRPPEPRPPVSQREIRPVLDVAHEFPEPNLNGRWAEFHDFQRLEPGREGRISLEPISPPPLAPRGLLSADREPEPRSSFLTIAVPGIAAILAVGALLWSGSLRDRVIRQDAQMTALQEQNRKLADTLAQMNADQKVVGALNASGSAPTSAPDQTTPNPTNQTAGSAQPPAPSGNDNAQAATAHGRGALPAPNLTASSRQVTSSAGKREGVSVPPSPHSSPQRRGGRPPVDTGYHPEIVPPYPTVSPTQSTAQGTPSSSPPAQRDHAASGVNSSAGAGASSTVPTRTPSPSAPAQSPASGTNPAPSYGIGSSPAHSGTDNSVYASALAQNIEAVEGLQRQSQVPLREFHARDGVQTKVTPGLFVSVRSPDQAHGTYALVVNGGAGNYQLRGYVNGPLGFVDNATHRGYQLVILRIAGEEVYGYIRPMR